MTETEGKKNENKTSIFLYFAAVTVHITSFIAGINICWNTPVSPKLETKEDNPLGTVLSVHEISWMASLVCLGATVGPFPGGYLADKIGRKPTLMSTATLAILSFTILTFSNSLYFYYAARFIGGISVGASFAVIPIYISEIADVHNRGALGGLTFVFIAAGNLYCYMVGPFVSVYWFTVSCTVFPVLFITLTLLFIPETPCFLIMKGANEEAKEALKKFGYEDVENKMAEITEMIQQSSTSSKGILDLFNTKYLIKALCISIGLMVIQQLTAFIPILLYIQGIFEKAVSSLSKEVSTIIIGVVQVVSTISSSAVVDKIGRRPLVLASTIATSLSLFSLSFYFYLLTTTDVSKIAWLPMIVLILYISFFNIGIGPLAFTVLGELFPPHVISTAISLTISSCFIVSFGVTKTFPILANLIGNWFAFLFFGVSNALGVVFLWFWMPETKGKTLNEITESLQ